MHNDTPVASSRSPAQSAALVPALALIAVLVAAIAPRSMPVALPLLALPVIALAAARVGRYTPPASQLLIALTLLGTYLCANAFWSIAPAHALGRVALFAAIVASGAALAAALPLMRPDEADRLSFAVLLAIGLAAIYLAIETPLGQPIRRFVISLVPPLRPAPKHMAAVDGWVSRINLYTLNRNLAVLNFLLWPGLLLLRSRLGANQARLAGTALVALTAVGVFTSEHETSMIALVVGCLVMAGMVVAAPVARALVVAAWLGATLLVVPAANLAHDAGLHRAAWLPQTARNRIVLWNVTADRMQASPVLGIGIGSTKPLDEEAGPTAPREAGDDYAQRTGRHAHNIFMQTWYELGAVGAVLLLLAGLAAIRVLYRLPAAHQPYAFASFASTMVLASFTWGMWQPWFMCAFGLWAAVLMTSLDAARRSDDAGTGIRPA